MIDPACFQNSVDCNIVIKKRKKKKKKGSIRLFWPPATSFNSAPTTNKTKTKQPGHDMTCVANQLGGKSKV